MPHFETFEILTEIKPKQTKEETFQTPSFINQKRKEPFKMGTGSTYYKSNILGKGPWTEEEDKMLIDLVEKYGPEKWSFISSFFPDRVGKQCRERWFNHLNPDVKKSLWLKEEEWILFLKHNEFGNKWSKLCEYLPGRTDNTIKNHWNSTMQKKIESFQKEFNIMIEGKTTEEIEIIKENLIQDCQKVIKNDNLKYYDEKQKNYEKFKNSKSDNKLVLSKLKKILLFRTHSKKTKKKGRKKKLFIKTYIYPQQKKTEPQKIPNPNIQITKNNCIIISKSILSNSNLITPNKNLQKDSLEVSPVLNESFKINTNSNKIFNFNPFYSSNLKKDFSYSNFNMEKSAFNKKVFSSDIKCSNIKTHLLFSSSIKKPIKIVSEDNFYGYNNENITPNRPFPINPNFDSSLNKSFSFKNSSQTMFEVNNPQNDKSPSKFGFGNLDKLFFSVINKDYENTSNKK